MGWITDYGSDGHERAEQAQAEAREQGALVAIHGHRAGDPPLGAEVLGCRVVGVVAGNRVLVCNRCGDRFEVTLSALRTEMPTGRRACDCVMQMGVQR